MADKEHLSTDTNKHYELNKYLDALVESGMAKTKEWSSLWHDNLRYFFSDQLRGVKKSKNWDWVVLNYIWPTAVQEMAKLSKNHPKIIANPWEDDDTDAAEVWQGSTQWLWENKLKMRLNQLCAILDGKIFGVRISKIYWENKVEWDGQQKKWIGDVKYKLWHPSGFWASPNAETIDEAEAVGTERWVDLEWAKRRWPGFETELDEAAKKFVGGSTYGGETIRGSYSATSGTGGSDTGRTESGIARFLSLILGIDKMTRTEKAQDERKKVKIEEIYFRDYAEIDREDFEDIPAAEMEMAGDIYNDGGIYYDGKTSEPYSPEKWPNRSVRKWKEPKYPTGRYIIRVGDVILNPREENQRYPYEQWPFVVTPHYILPHMWQGLDACSLYKDTQDWINVTISHLTNNMKMFGDPKIIVEDDTISAPKGARSKKHYRIGAAAGAVIRLVRGGMNRFKILDPKPLGAGSALLYQLFTQEFKNLTGLQSPARGEKEEGSMTATESTHLMMSAHDRIHLQSIYEDEWVKQVAGRIAEITQRNYDVGRFARIVGEDKAIGIQQITQGLKDAKFDIDIEPGATLPYDEEKRTAKYVQAYEIMGQPVANPMLPEMLRELGITNWKKLLQKHEAWLMFMGFFELYNAVKEGKISPRQAVQILLNQIMQRLGQEAMTTIEGVSLKNEAKERALVARDTELSERERGIKRGEQKQKAEKQKKESKKK